MTPPRPAPSHFVPFAVACFGIVIFSGMDAVMKSLSIALGAYNAIFWRSVTGVVLIAPLYLLKGRPDPPTGTR